MTDQRAKKLTSLSHSLPSVNMQASEKKGISTKMIASHKINTIIQQHEVIVLFDETNV